MNGKTLVSFVVCWICFSGKGTRADEQIVERGKRVRVAAPAPHVLSGTIAEESAATLTTTPYDGASQLTYTRGQRTVTGTLQSVNDDVIVLELSPSKKTIRIPRSALVRWDVSEAPSRRRRGALVGAVVGAGVALTLAAIATSKEEDTFLRFGYGAWAAGFSVLCVPSGAGIGALVTPGERWRPVQLDAGVSKHHARGLVIQYTVSF